MAGKKKIIFTIALIFVAPTAFFLWRDWGACWEVLKGPLAFLIFGLGIASMPVIFKLLGGGLEG